MRVGLPGCYTRKTLDFRPTIPKKLYAGVNGQVRLKLIVLCSSVY
jgi:hypothetical protein